LAVNNRMNHMVKSRYSTNWHQIILDLIMIFIAITIIIENTDFSTDNISRSNASGWRASLNTMQNIRHWVVCGCTSADCGSNVKKKTESERIYRFYPILLCDFIVDGYFRRINVDWNVLRIYPSFLTNT